MSDTSFPPSNGTYLEDGLGNGLLVYNDELHGRGVDSERAVEVQGGRKVEDRACRASSDACIGTGDLEYPPCAHSCSAMLT